MIQGGDEGAQVGIAVFGIALQTSWRSGIRRRIYQRCEGFCVCGWFFTAPRSSGEMPFA